jgi:hypothetical protein
VRSAWLPLGPFKPGLIQFDARSRNTSRAGGWRAWTAPKPLTLSRGTAMIRNMSWYESLLPLGIIVVIALYMASLAPS